MESHQHKQIAEFRIGKIMCAIHLTAKLLPWKWLVLTSDIETSSSRKPVSALPWMHQLLIPTSHTHYRHPSPTYRTHTSSVCWCSLSLQYTAIKHYSYAALFTHHKCIPLSAFLHQQHPHLLQIPSTHTKLAERAFSISGSTACNSSPLHLRFLAKI